MQNRNQSDIFHRESLDFKIHEILGKQQVCQAWESSGPRVRLAKVNHNVFSLVTPSNLLNGRRALLHEKLARYWEVYEAWRQTVWVWYYAKKV